MGKKIYCGKNFLRTFAELPKEAYQNIEPPKEDLTGIATVSFDPLATYHLAGRKPTKRKGGRK